MGRSVTIREFAAEDVAICIAIYRDAILNGTAPHYTPREAAAWAPDGPDPGDWSGRLSTGATWIAETAEGAQGFITLAPHGHLDLFFARPAARGLGVAAMLYGRLVTAARADGHTTLTTDASHLARRFLDRREWNVQGEERALRNGVWLTRFRMSHDLET